MTASSDSNDSVLAAFIAAHGLPVTFAATAEKFFVPLAGWLHQRVAARGGHSFVLGINAAQGAGKSTLAEFLAACLRARWGHNVAILSIDDLYLSRAGRQTLARTVHPLLATRGVPGTHDPELGRRTLQRLRELGAGEHLRLPRFDKLRDDRLPAARRPLVAGPVNVVLFEGWCVGSRPEPDQALAAPVNELERTRDGDGTWRRFVNRQLGAGYQALFEQLDALLFLAVPDFDCVRRWRMTQEHQLIAAGNGVRSRGMSDAEVLEFVQHFERLTRHNLATLPQLADVVFRLGQDHQVVAAKIWRQ